jgi:DNA-binding NarL/FixJ family response regulator
VIKVLIADDHEIVREGLKHILATSSEIMVSAEAGSGEEVISLIGDADFDVILLDISLPGRSGIDTLDQIKSMNPDQAVLILSMYSEERFAVRSLMAGASGYLTKNSAPAELINAIIQVSSGQTYISNSLSVLLASNLEVKDEIPPHTKLSNREYEIVQLIASGLSNKEVASQLSLSPKTISSHRTRILEKLGVNNIPELMQYLIHHKLVDGLPPL